MVTVFQRLPVITRDSWFVCLAIVLLAPAAFASKKEAEAAALIDRAKQLCDIRSEGAPAFRLRIHFKVTQQDGSSQIGAYTETWVSKAQWRRETVLGDFRRIEVASGRKLWRLDSAATAPEHIADILGFFDIGRPKMQFEKPDQIDDQQIRGVSVRCIQSRPDPRGERSSLCLDKNSGTLAAEHRPLRVGMRRAGRDCVFSDYRNFGARMVPGSYQCYEDEHLKFQAEIAEIAAESAPDPALFSALDGGKESVNCLSPIKSGMVIDRVQPKFPFAVSIRNAIVVIDATIGTDGRLHELKVVSDPNPQFDEAALDALKQWRYKPYTCDGEPIEVETEMELSFRRP